MKQLKKCVLLAFIYTASAPDLTANSRQWQVQISSKKSDQGHTPQNTTRLNVPSDKDYKFDLKGSKLKCILEKDDGPIGLRTIDCGIFSVSAGFQIKTVPSSIKLSIPAEDGLVHMISVSCE
jgi:hypothetical protein